MQNQKQNKGFNNNFTYQNSQSITGSSESDLESDDNSYDNQRLNMSSDNINIYSNNKLSASLILEKNHSDHKNSSIFKRKNKKQNKSQLQYKKKVTQSFQDLGVIKDYKNESKLITMGMKQQTVFDDKVNSQIQQTIQEQFNKKQTNNIDKDEKDKLKQGKAVMKEELVIVNDYFKKNEKKSSTVLVEPKKSNLSVIVQNVKNEGHIYTPSNKQSVIVDRNSYLTSKKASMHSDYNKNSFINHENNQQYLVDNVNIYFDGYQKANKNQNDNNIIQKKSKIAKESIQQEIITEDREEDLQTYQQRGINIDFNEDINQNQNQQNNDKSENESERSLSIESIQNKINQSDIKDFQKKQELEKQLFNKKEISEEFKMLKKENTLIVRSKTDFNLSLCLFEQIRDLFKNNNKNDKVTVHSPEMVKTKLGLKHHIQFTIDIKVFGKKYKVIRRYKQFQKLEEILRNNWPGIYIPPLPARDLSQKNAQGLVKHLKGNVAGSYNIDKIDERTRHLEYFLMKIVDSKFLLNSEVFKKFIEIQDENILNKYLKLYRKQDIFQISEYYKHTFKLFEELPVTEEIQQKFKMFEKWIKRVYLRALKLKIVSKRIKNFMNKYYKVFNDFKDDIGKGYQEEILEYRNLFDEHHCYRYELESDAYNDVADFMQNELYDISALQYAFQVIDNLKQIEDKTKQDIDDPIKKIIKNKFTLERNHESIKYLRTLLIKIYGYYFIDSIRFEKQKLYQYMMKQTSEMEIRNFKIINSFWEQYLGQQKDFVKFRNKSIDDEFLTYLNNSDTKINDINKSNQKIQENEDQIENNISQLSNNNNSSFYKNKKKKQLLFDPCQVPQPRTLHFNIKH